MTNCFFSIFDIIGFSNLLNEKGSEGLYEVYSNVVLPMIQYAAMPEFKSIKKDDQTFSVPNPNSRRVNYSFFSDTIFYYSEGDSFDSFIKILFTSLELLKSGFCGSKTPYRGAIGYGDIIYDQNGILLGTSIIDAHKGEQEQMWSGCIITETCANFCLEKQYFDKFYKLFENVLSSEGNEKRITDYKKAQKSLVRYNVPKQRKDLNNSIEYYKQEHYVLDWTQNVYEGASERSFNPSEIHHQQMIKNNTIEFESWARMNNKLPV